MNGGLKREVFAGRLRLVADRRLLTGWMAATDS
jgi:hypothetical protein